MTQPRPFCSQPWSTLYIQWDGKVTRPCIRGPQNLGAIQPETDLVEFWNNDLLRSVRESVRNGENLSAACAGCHKDRARTIDHLTPFADNLASFSFEQIDNYYEAMGNYESGSASVSNRPVALILDLSSKCQIRCPKCFVYNSDLQYGLGHMTMETFGKIIPLLKTAFQVIGHENGESMLNKNFMQMTQLIKENGCRFSFNTTGQLLSEEKSRMLVELGVDQIMFSIDSIEAEKYAVLHKGGTLQKLMDNLTTLNRLKVEHGAKNPLLGWYFVASRSNITELPSIIDKAAELNFNSMYISPLNRPSSEQWKSYWDYYRSENLQRTAQDVELYEGAIDKARALTRERNIILYT